MSAPMIHNADELEALAQRMGLLPFHLCSLYNQESKGMLLVFSFAKTETADPSTQ